jgi:hypothetical protein
MHGDLGTELPKDIEDGMLYVAVPHKNDLELGRTLVFAFVEEVVPIHLRTVEAYFRQRGAYAKFKALLERERLVEHWYEYEAIATRAALEQWAVENSFVVVRSASDA